MTPEPAASAADWRPCATPERLRARARLLAELRAYFAAAGVLEVETPLLSSAAATDPALASLESGYLLPGAGRQRGFLHTSPEYPMKRLLAAGSGPIYQVCKVFRDGERGRWHHPEFTLLEWYRPGWSYTQLMEDVAGLVRRLLAQPGRPAERPVERISYRALFQERLGLDPWHATPAGLARVAERQGLAEAARLDLDRDGWLDLLLTHCLQSGLGRGCLSFLCDYPPSQAALARVRWEADEGLYVAERFELYVEGIELANGFQELTDPAEQAARFAADLAAREAAGADLPPRDRRLLDALAAGLPATSGVALGLDRLLMLATGARHIDEVLAFPIERA